jgi:hypothetical protein
LDVDPAKFWYEKKRKRKEKKGKERKEKKRKEKEERMKLKLGCYLILAPWGKIKFKDKMANKKNITKNLYKGFKVHLHRIYNFGTFELSKLIANLKM